MESAISEQKLQRIQALFGRVAALVAKRDGDTFLAAAIAPAPQRADLFTLYAFRNEITRIPFMVSEPMIGEIRLQWWREAIEEICGDGPVRSHEVVTPLAELIKRLDLPRGLFDTFINGFSDDLAEEPAPTMAALGMRVASREAAMMELAAHIGGAEKADFGKAAKAHGLTRALIDLPRHASQGRCLIPLDILRETDADPHALFRGDFDDRLAKAFGMMCGQAHAAFAETTKLDKTARAAALPAAIAKASLKEISKAGFNPFTTDPRPALFKQQWAAWRFLRTGRL